MGVYHGKSVSQRGKFSTPSTERIRIALELFPPIAEELYSRIFKKLHRFASSVVLP